MRQTACARRFLPAMIGGGTWEGAHARHEAAGVRQPARRRGGGVAARGARAAGGDAGDRISSYPGAPELSAGLWRHFAKGLSETGYRRGPQRRDRISLGRTMTMRTLPELAADLVRRQVAVIVAPGGTPRPSRPKRRPRPFRSSSASGTDPVEVGLVASLNRPGGNVTGVSSMNSELAAKRLGCCMRWCRTLALRRAGQSDQSAMPKPLTRDVQATRFRRSGGRSKFSAASTAREIDAAFAKLAQKRADALFVSPDPLLDNRRVQLRHAGGTSTRCRRSIPSARMSRPAD